jgi:hypothetical protein
VIKKRQRQTTPLVLEQLGFKNTAQPKEPKMKNIKDLMTMPKPRGEGGRASMVKMKSSCEKLISTLGNKPCQDV